MHFLLLDFRLHKGSMFGLTPFKKDHIYSVHPEGTIQGRVIILIEDFAPYLDILIPCPSENRLQTFSL